MAWILLKIAAGTGMAVVSLGLFPNRLMGGIVAVAACVAAAFILHFVAP